MTDPVEMTPERWRLVDTILQAALACEPERRDAFVADACGADEALAREVSSLLAAHGAATNNFLERPPVAWLDIPTAPVTQRIAAALGGRYAIEREVAHGGMATVYLARDVRHDRRVAVKVMRDEVASLIGAERFLEEIRVTASLQHPHILPLFDSGSAGGLLWYVMPFVDGETLRSRLTREPRLPLDDALRITREVAEALDHAHARGIVHRDVKPENVLLHEGHALVADFGIALALEHAGGERLTRTGLTLGTPLYMAPEQAAGERALDARVDIYALGAVLYEMLVGEPPFAAESRQVIIQRTLSEPPASLIGKRAEVTPRLDAAVRRALAKRPDDRFSTATELAAALVAPLDGNSPRAVEPVRRLERLPSAVPVAPSARRMVTARLAVYLALAGVAVGVMSGWGLAHTPAAGWWGQRRQPLRQPTSDPAPDLASVSSADGSGANRDALSLGVVDRAGRLQRTIDANRPWTPRFSPDGRRVAYGAFGSGRNTSDIWVADLDAGTTRRLTDDDADSNDPQWSPDGRTVAYSVRAPGGKDLASRPLAGGPPRMLATREGTQFASDWLRDGSALMVTDEGGPNRHDILVQPSDGSAARPYAATTADETAARVSPDEHWVAYTSDESGRNEVYLDSYPRPRRRIMISRSGGADPVWRGDGRELYYWRGDALVAVQVGAAKGEAPPPIDSGTVLFHAPYQGGLNTMYDVSPDGARFAIVERR